MSPDGRSVYLWSETWIGVLAREPSGRLRQLKGKVGCLSHRILRPGCDTMSTPIAIDLALSPDGRNVYTLNRGVTGVLRRDVATGALQQVPGVAGCVGRGYPPGSCTDVRGVGFPRVVFGADGRFAYAVSRTGYPPSGIAVFVRDPLTGLLTQLPGPDGCVVSEASGDKRLGCAVVVANDSFTHLHPVPGGRYVIAGGYYGTYVLRVTSRGALEPIPPPDGCFSDHRFSFVVGCRPDPDPYALHIGSRFIYFGLTAYTVDDAGFHAGRAPAAALAGLELGALSPRGDTAFLWRGDFIREPSDLVLVPVAEDGALLEPAAGGGNVVPGIRSFALTADGRLLLVRRESGVQAYRVTGSTVTALPGLAAVPGARELTLSPDGRHVYVQGTGGVFGFATPESSPPLVRPARQGTLRSGMVALWLACPATESRCTGSVRLETRGRSIGEAAFALWGGASGRVRVALSSASAPARTMTAVVVARDLHGNVGSTRTRITV